jgi:hypothetical protein
MKLDQGFGTGFDAHVMAGYRFLMRYYESGDKIFMFGFSRGAFTAKFLARMIHTVGLLCRGNEEMVPFAYRLYQRYLAGQIQKFKDKRQGTVYDKTSTKDPVKSKSMQNDEIAVFSNTFCRKEKKINHETGEVDEDNIQVFFLGMWDCVNSVKVLERAAERPIGCIGIAKYVRHAVAVDERRVKFKPALLAQDIRASAEDPRKDPHEHHEDIKEVWFPGCHGDVGGGYPAGASKKSDKRLHEAKDVDSGLVQMSDIPLAWMIHELEQLPTMIVWRKPLVEKFWQRIHKHKHQALRGAIHDSLRFGSCADWYTVLFWKILGTMVPLCFGRLRCANHHYSPFPERFPFLKRWELGETGWKLIGRPLNKGAARDIPSDATLHESLIWRLQNVDEYSPSNNHGGKSSTPCLSREAEFEDLEAGKESFQGHRVFKFKGLLKSSEAPKSLMQVTARAID